MSKQRSLLVLVTGATGHQGGAVARALLDRGHRVRALTRRPDSEIAEALKSLGAEIVEGDFNDAPSLERAMQKVDAVFAMGTRAEKGVVAEINEGILLADAAKKMGITHYIYSSVAGANKNTGIPHFDSKYEIEQYIHKLKIPATIIRPAYFMENLLNPSMMEELRQGRLKLPFPNDRKIQMVAVEDIGQVVVHALENRSFFIGKEIEIASDKISPQQIAEILSKILDKRIKAYQQPIEQFQKLGEDYMKMIKWIDEVGFSVNIPILQQSCQHIIWHNFEEWARLQRWSLILNPLEIET